MFFPIYLAYLNCGTLQNNHSSSQLKEAVIRKKTWEIKQN